MLRQHHLYPPPRTSPNSRALLRGAQPLNQYLSLHALHQRPHRHRKVHRAWLVPARCHGSSGPAQEEAALLDPGPCFCRRRADRLVWLRSHLRMTVSLRATRSLPRSHHKTRPGSDRQPIAGLEMRRTGRARKTRPQRKALRLRRETCLDYLATAPLMSRRTTVLHELQA